MAGLFPNSGDCISLIVIGQGALRGRAVVSQPGVAVKEKTRELDVKRDHVPFGGWFHQASENTGAGASDHRQSSEV